MSRFLNLIKINLINQLGLNKLFRKKNKTSIIVGSLTLLIGLCFIYFFIGFMFFQVVRQLGEDVGPSVVLSGGLISGGILLLMTVVVRANAYLFRAKDFDLLASLPIPTSSITLAKILSFIVTTYLTLSFTFIPMIVVYAIYVQTTFLYWITAILVFLLLPLLIISIFSFVSYLFATLLSRFKYKNLISIIGYLAFFLGILFLNFQGGTDDQTANLFVALDKQIKYIYYPAYIAKEALTTGRLIYHLSFIALSVIPFIIFIHVTGKFYLRINTSLSTTRNSTKFDEKTIDKKQTGIIKLLTKMEFKKFFSIPVYVMNTLGSKVAGVFLMGLMYFQLRSQLGTIQTDIFALIMFAITIFMGTLSPATAVTFSIEGKKLWILKTSPATEKQIFFSKALVDFIPSVVLGYISVILIIIMMQPSILISVLMFAVLTALLIHTAILGLLINLKFPKLDWDLPIKAVKQSLSVFITMLIGMILMGALVALTFVLGNAIDLEIGLLIVLGIIIIITVLEYILLSTMGVKWYQKIKS
ncbi:putative ABC transporter permease subunit [Haploplasma axanthum]|uniref:Uncharacterized protein n=1 Tax=Haploplasma axanthum TaxID=29552 RepID=A0A449BD30_HAPAX|nr:hypothetical protein [Haploplasma axanthum]VEU80371.1 Uncharacterised protein [Haploplasma axanthum]